MTSLLSTSNVVLCVDCTELSDGGSYALLSTAVIHETLPIESVVAVDLNHDGHLDVLLFGRNASDETTFLHAYLGMVSTFGRLTVDVGLLWKPILTASFIPTSIGPLTEPVLPDALPADHVRHCVFDGPSPAVTDCWGWA